MRLKGDFKFLPKHGGSQIVAELGPGFLLSRPLSAVLFAQPCEEKGARLEIPCILEPRKALSNLFGGNMEGLLHKKA